MLNIYQKYDWIVFSVSQCAMTYLSSVVDRIILYLGMSVGSLKHWAVRCHSSCAEPK